MTLFRASGNAELLRVFLAAGADPNVKDGGGCTLLHYLAGFPATKPSIEVLLEFTLLRRPDRFNAVDVNQRAENDAIGFWIGDCHPSLRQSDIFRVAHLVHLTVR